MHATLAQRLVLILRDRHNFDVEISRKIAAKSSLAYDLINIRDRGNQREIQQRKGKIL